MLIIQVVKINIQASTVRVGIGAIRDARVLENEHIAQGFAVGEGGIWNATNTDSRSAFSVRIIAVAIAVRRTKIGIIAPRLALNVLLDVARVEHVQEARGSKRGKCLEAARMAQGVVVKIMRHQRGKVTCSSAVALLDLQVAIFLLLLFDVDGCIDTRADTKVRVQSRCYSCNVACHFNSKK